MNQERLMRVLMAPHISEKSTLAGDQGNQHVFRVLPDASKAEIRQAVEQLFEVKVDKVRTINMRGKSKRFGQMMGRRNHWKKAYVTLQAGYDIDLGGAE
ncbi:MAG: 50S ribosomal protein L23 [Thiohalocapsa sp.]|jgi:large subunit ribosomal protein L23